MFGEMLNVGGRKSGWGYRIQGSGLLVSVMSYQPTAFPDVGITRCGYMERKTRKLFTKKKASWQCRCQLEKTGVDKKKFFLTMPFRLWKTLFLSIL